MRWASTTTRNWPSLPCTWPRPPAAATSGRDPPLGPRQRIPVPALQTGLPQAGREPVQAASARASTAVSEAFNSVLKVEYVHRHTFATRTEARIRIATWITGFYNARRLHSVCGYRSPIDYECDHRANLALGFAA